MHDVDFIQPILVAQMLVLTTNLDTLHTPLTISAAVTHAFFSVSQQFVTSSRLCFQPSNLPSNLHKVLLRFVSYKLPSSWERKFPYRFRYVNLRTGSSFFTLIVIAINLVGLARARVIVEGVHISDRVERLPRRPSS